MLSPGEFEPLPINPRPVSLEYLLAAKADAQWVSFTNTVRQAAWISGELYLRLGAQDAGVTAHFLQPVKPTNLATLFRARVSIRGVCVEQADEQGKVEAFSVFAASPDELQVLTLAGNEPFDAPLCPIADCLDPARWVGKDPWARTKGTVSRGLGDQCFFLDDGKRGIEVRTSAASGVQAGDQLEVAGFIVQEGLITRMEDALVRENGKASPPVPLALAAGQIRNRQLCASTRLCWRIAT